MLQGGGGKDVIYSNNATLLLMKSKNHRASTLHSQENRQPPNWNSMENT